MGVVVSGLPEFPLPDHVRGMFRKVLGGDMNYDGLITIDSEICRKDGLCVRVCPKVFTQTEPRAVPDVARPEFCNDCGHCLLVCPAGAIRHRNLEGRGITEVEKDLLPSFRQVQEMVRARRSIRNFLDKPVERELMEKVIDAARFAPSAKNTQSTRFIAIDNGETLRRIASMTAAWLGRSAKKLRNPLVRAVYLMRGLTTKEEYSRWIGQFELTARNMDQGIDTILYRAPALVLFHADRRVRFAEANANLALQNATFATCALNLGTFYTGYVVSACAHDRAIPDMLGVPKGHRVYAGMTLGHVKIGFSRWIDRNPARIDWI
jgi:nitroreductase/NAD-dependent dihydropyrimidine dehydrogenase PreA subunit